MEDNPFYSASRKKGQLTCGCSFTRPGIKYAEREKGPITKFVSHSIGQQGFSCNGS